MTILFVFCRPFYLKDLIRVQVVLFLSIANASKSDQVFALLFNYPDDIAVVLTYAEHTLVGLWIFGTPISLA